MLSLSHLIVILLILLLLFGAGKLPSVMADLAKGIKSFKKNLDSDDSCNAKNINKDSEEEKNVIKDVSSVSTLDSIARDDKILVEIKSSNKSSSKPSSKNSAKTLDKSSQINPSKKVSTSVSSKVSKKTKKTTKSESPKSAIPQQNKKS